MYVGELNLKTWNIYGKITGKVKKYFEKRIGKPFQPVEELKQLNAK